MSFSIPSKSNLTENLDPSGPNAGNNALKTSDSKASFRAAPQAHVRAVTFSGWGQAKSAIDTLTKERNFPVDDAVTLAAAAKVASQRSSELSLDEEAALAALRRAHPSAGQTNEELGQWLSEMSAEQLRGVVNNAKGVLHEMRFVELENTDGDTVYASQFAATNHQSFDIMFSDNPSGAQWEAQLKATDSSAYVNEWLEKHPGGEILVTSEVADRLDIKSSGISNAELTADTQDLVDSLIAAGENDTLWDYFPSLTAVSIALVIFEFHKRLEQGEITQKQFRRLVAKASGRRAARVLAITALLSIPGLNVVTAIALIANALNASGLLEKANSGLDKINQRLETKIEAMNALEEFECAVWEERIWVEEATQNAEKNFERGSELAEELKDENFRHIYEEEKAKIEATLAELSSKRPSKFLVEGDKKYINPDDVQPAICDDELVEAKVRSKVERLQVERESRFKEARLILQQDHLRPHFRDIIERNFSAAYAEELIAAILSGARSDEAAS